MRKRREIMQEILSCYREKDKVNTGPERDVLSEKIKTLEWVLEGNPKKKKNV